MTNIPSGRGGEAVAYELPSPSAYRKFLANLGAQVTSGSAAHPRGGRGEAAQMAGMVKGLTEQVENGLRGTALQTDFQKGWLAVHQRSVPAVTAGLSAQAADLAKFCAEGIRNVPLASRQWATAVYALQVAESALLGASHVAAGEFEQVAEVSEVMCKRGEELALYIAKLRSEFGTEDEPRVDPWE
ncbi:hypothetical protein KCMC57_65050 (plasmid) [Kitasatospora sp. CMC57]|uniref:Uncharacterized protein n=1 Tax=Kitasatospora sp. CMC57 TaxID=3231513 RepID=A0AB33KCC0_9ACTN